MTAAITAAGRASITAENRRTLDTLFHNPTTHDLAWDSVITLIAHLGDVEERSNDNFAFKIGRITYDARKPHTQHLTSPEVMGFRQFLASSGWSPETHDERPRDAGI